MHIVVVLVLGFVASACANPSSDFRYDLRCEGLATQIRGAVACLRLDTSSGETAWINIDQLTKLGASAAEQMQGTSGRFALECGVSNTPKEATMRCVRLDRTTGELVSLDLSRLPRLPAPTK